MCPLLPGLKVYLATIRRQLQSKDFPLCLDADHRGAQQLQETVPQRTHEAVLVDSGCQVRRWSERARGFTAGDITVCTALHSTALPVSMPAVIRPGQPGRGRAYEDSILAELPTWLTSWLGKISHSKELPWAEGVRASHLGQDEPELSVFSGRLI